MWIVGRDSSVGMANCYRLDGPGVKCRWGRYFLHSFRSAMGPTQHPVQWRAKVITGDSGRNVALTTQNSLTFCGSRRLPVTRLINPLNPELNPICYLLALLAHHFLHVSRIRVKSLTIRLLMSYIYIWSTYS